MFTTNDSDDHNSGQTPDSLGVFSAGSAQDLIGYAPDLDRLKSALMCTPPSGDAQAIAFHFVAPMARAAIEFPEVEGAMMELACAWSCGELHAGKFPGLTAITRGGKTGIELFAELWHRFLFDTSYKGPRRSLGSIYHLAKAKGWAYSEY